MTDLAIKEQIDATKMITERVAQSKEAALKFLTEAGIIGIETKSKKPNQKKK